MGENCSCNGRHLNLRSANQKVLACASVAAGLMAVLVTASAVMPAHADTSNGSEAGRADSAALEVVLPDPFDQTAACESCHVFEDVAETRVEEAPAATSGDVAKEDGNTAKEGDQTPAPSADEELAALHPAVGCTSCHEVDEWLEKAHKDYLTSTKVPKKLKYTSVGNDVCLACHGSWEELAEKTSDVDACTDVLGMTVNPHGASASHTADDGHLNCVLCHKGHDEQTKADLDEAASKACITCHHNNEYMACTECHAS